MDKPDKAQILKDFKDNIRLELDQCNSLDTPHVCANISSEEGYRKTEKLIMEKVMTSRLTIGEAIVQIENELNPDAYGNN